MISASDKLGRNVVTAGVDANTRRLCPVAFIARALTSSIALPVLLAACAPHDASESLREFSLSSEPVLSIGSDQAPETEFFRVAAAWRLASGRLVVVNRGSSELRVFDAAGRFLSAFGRSGEGPGEFRHIGWAAHFGDTAIVYDGNLRRLSVIALEEGPRLAASLPVRVDDDRDVSVVGRFADGNWLVYSLARPNMSLMGFQRVPAGLGVLEADAVGSVRWLTESPDLSVILHSPDADSKMVSVATAAFPASLVFLASGRLVWLGDAAADTLMLLNADGTGRRIVKLPYAPDSLSREWLDTARSRELDAARDEASRALVASKYSASFLPKTLPAFQAFIPGPGGEIWIQRPAVSPTVAVTYTVFAPTGEARARLTSASGFRVTDAGIDYVVGVHRDADGVETIHQYALSRD